MFLVLVAVVPALFSPRRFEFYDDAIKIHKILGGDSEIPYSNISLLDYPARGRSQQVVLSIAGQRRPLVIGKNPTNQSLGMDLKQFLNSKLKKPEPAGNSGSDSSQEAGGSNTRDSPQLSALSAIYRSCISLLRSLSHRIFIQAIFLLSPSWTKIFQRTLSPLQQSKCSWAASTKARCQ